MLSSIQGRLKLGARGIAMRVCTMISCVCCMQLLGTQIAWENSCFIVEVLYFE